MKSHNHVLTTAAIAFATSLSFSLVACDDSSSASGDDVPGSSDSGSALGSSGSGDVPGSSGSVPAGMEGLPDDVLAVYSILPQCGEFRPEGSCNSITGGDGKEYRFECVGTKWEYNQDCEEPKCLTATSRIEHPECELQECNAEIEGLVEHMTPGYHPAYQSNVEYYRCEQGEWLQVEANAACDTAGVSVGDVCDMRIAYAGAKSGHDSFNCYRYLGDGAWKTIATDVWAGETCFAVQGDLPPEIAGAYYSSFYGVACDDKARRSVVKLVDGSEYAFQCVEGKWEVSEYVSNPKCLTPNALFEPECVLQECNAEIEGLVEHMTPGSNPGYQSNVEYYRCEQGEWHQVEASAACDTAGVSVGDVCDMRVGYAGVKYGHDSFNCYKYLGDGAWKAIATDARTSGSCFAVQGDLPPDIAGWYYSFYHEADCDETSDLPIQSDDGTWYLLQCVEAKWEISEYQECNDESDSCYTVQEGETAPSDSTDEQ
jgi:hypothetical protein